MYLGDSVSQKNSPKVCLFVVPYPQSTVILPVVAIMKEMKQNKNKITVSSFLSEFFVYMEEKTREGRTRRMMKELVGCVKSVVGNNKFLVQFKDAQKIDMGYCLIVYVCSKEDVGHEVNKPISDPPPNNMNCLLFMSILLMNYNARLKKVYVYLFFVVCVLEIRC